MPGGFGEAILGTLAAAGAIRGELALHAGLPDHSDLAMLKQAGFEMGVIEGYVEHNRIPNPQGWGIR